MSNYGSFEDRRNGGRGKLFEIGETSQVIVQQRKEELKKENLCEQIANAIMNGIVQTRTHTAEVLKR